MPPDDPKPKNPADWTDDQRKLIEAEVAVCLKMKASSATETFEDYLANHSGSFRSEPFPQEAIDGHRANFNESKEYWASKTEQEIRAEVEARFVRPEPMPKRPRWLTRRFLEKAFNFAYCRVKTRTSARYREELESDAFDRVSDYIRKNPGKEPSLNLVIEIMYCAMIDYFRASKLRRNVEVLVAINPRGYSPAGTRIEPDGSQVGPTPQELPALPKRAKVKRALVIEVEVFEKLDCLDQFIVLLAMDGLNQAEIAEALCEQTQYAICDEIARRVGAADFPEDEESAEKIVMLSQQAVSKRLTKIKRLQAQHEKKMGSESRVRRLISPAEDARIL